MYQLTRAVDIFESDIVEFLACETPLPHPYLNCKFHSMLAVVLVMKYQWNLCTKVLQIQSYSHTAEYTDTISLKKVKDAI